MTERDTTFVTETNGRGQLSVVQIDEPVRDITWVENGQLTVRQSATVSSFFDQWIDPTVAASITGSPVSDIAWPNYDGSFTTAPRFQQSTSGARPSITASRLVFDGTADYMDMSGGYTTGAPATLVDDHYSEAGKGFTCTGMARYSDGRIVLGAFGKLNESTAAGETADGALHIFASMSDVLAGSAPTQSIRFQALSLSDVGIQGIAIDESAGIIYCADVVNGRIYGIDPTGPTLTYNFALANANGLAYDSVNGELLVWASSGVGLLRVNKTTGSTIATLANFFRDSDNPDHLFFDGTYLWSSQRGNNTPGRVMKYSYTQVVQTSVPVRSWIFAPTITIEGFVVVGNTLYACDDAYYHNATANVNRIVPFTIDPSSEDYGTTLVLAALMHVNATPGATVAAFHGGDGIGKKGAGLFWTTTVNQLRMVCRAGGTQATVDWTQSSTTTAAIIYVLIDTAAGEASLYENGTLVSTQSNAQLTGSIPRLAWTLGASFESTGVATRFSTLRLGGFIVSTRDDRAEIEGHLAHATENTGLLPSDHPYKTVPPTI